jgi:hypothetical protein
MKTIGIFVLIFFAFSGLVPKKKPHVVFVCGDHEYSGEVTMPLIAAELEKNYGLKCTVLSASPNQNAEENIPNLEVLKTADLAIFFLRWRRLPPDQLKEIESYLTSGKPIMGFRTSTHAFNFPNDHPSAAWNAFGEWAFNSPPGWGKEGHTHYGHTSTTEVSVIADKAKHPILTGVGTSFKAKSWLYHVLPKYPSNGSEGLLMGKSINSEKPNPVENPVAWVGKNKYGAKVFFTTLGHPEDFSEEALQRLTINAIHWQLGKKIPKKWSGRIAINVPYRGIVK